MTIILPDSFRIHWVLIGNIWFIEIVFVSYYTVGFRFFSIALDIPDQV